MNRRRLMVAVITIAVSAGIVECAVARSANSAAVFLHDLYARETERHNKRLSPDNDAFYALFTHDLRDLMKAQRLPNPNVPLGPILHALFGRSVLPGTEAILSGVTAVRDDQGSAMLNVMLNVRGEIRTLAVALRRENGAWRIHDIEYAPGDTLTGHYRRITGR
jgi:hypothetical protein